MANKTLQQKFLDEDKLNLFNNLRINLLRRASDCDGMCGFYEICGYCEVYKSNYNQNKKENKN